MNKKEILKDQLKNQYALMLNEKDIDALLKKIKENNGVDGVIDSILFYDNISSFYDDTFELISQYLDTIYLNRQLLINDIDSGILESFNLEDIEKILNKQNIDDEQDSEDIKSVLVWFILEKLAGL